MKILVVGGGKVGYYLTKTLLEHKHTPFVIEAKRELCTRLSNDLDIPVICGDGSMTSVLEAAHISEVDALIAVTGRDQDNLIACQLAKTLFRVPRTVSRINNPKNAEIMKKLGVDITISATANIARLLEREVDTAAIRSLLTLNSGKASLSELVVPEQFKHSGEKLMDLSLPEECVIVTITREGEMIIPRGNISICSGDKLLVVCADTALRQLAHDLGFEE